MLSSDEYMDDAPTDVGVRVRINHDTPFCRGHSKSMVIELWKDGSIHAKCFRCGDYGRTGKANHKMSIRPTSIPKPKEYEFPDDIEYNWEKWDVRAVAYVNKYGFTNEDTRRAMIGWSVLKNRLILPIKNQEVPLAGWQGKSFDGEPRYVTYAKDNQLMYWQHHSYSDSVVIVEDVLSALRASDNLRSTVLSSIALLGTSINNHLFRELSVYSVFYIWLDNDNPQVRRDAQKIANKLGLFGKVSVIHVDTEVKHLSFGEFEHILYM